MNPDKSKRCHLLVPSVSHAEVGRGGINHYRGIALAMAENVPTFVHEPAMPLAACEDWNVSGCSVRSWESPQRMIDALRREAGPGDVIVKYAGAFGVQADVAVEHDLLDVRASTGARLVYADPDAPHRLPLITAGIDAPWRRFDEVWVFQGGARACAEYASLAEGQVKQAPFSVSALPTVRGAGHPAPTPREWRSRRYDLVITVGARSAREDRLTAFVGELAARSGRQLDVGVCGDVERELLARVDSRRVRVERHPLRDPHRLPEFYRLGRYTFNALRAECRGYADVPSCRLFEAAAAGSIPVTEDFPDRDRYFDEGVHVLLAGDDVALPPPGPADHARLAVATAARVRVLAEDAVREIGALLHGVTPAEPRQHDEEPPALRGELAVVGEWPGDVLAAVEAANPDLSTVTVTAGALVARNPAAIAVTAENKNAVDAVLRSADVRVGRVFVLTTPGSGGQVRWVPGRDVAVPDDTPWPWLVTTPAGADFERSGT